MKCDMADRQTDRQTERGSEGARERESERAREGWGVRERVPVIMSYDKKERTGG